MSTQVSADTRVETHLPPVIRDSRSDDGYETFWKVCMVVSLLSTALSIGCGIAYDPSHAPGLNQDLLEGAIWGGIIVDFSVLITVIIVSLVKWYRIDHIPQVHPQSTWMPLVDYLDKYHGLGKSWEGVINGNDYCQRYINRAYQEKIYGEIGNYARQITLFVGGEKVDLNEDSSKETIEPQIDRLLSGIEDKNRRTAWKYCILSVLSQAASNYVADVLEQAGKPNQYYPLTQSQHSMGGYQINVRLEEGQPVVEIAAIYAEVADGPPNAPVGYFWTCARIHLSDKPLDRGVILEYQRVTI